MMQKIFIFVGLITHASCFSLFTEVINIPSQGKVQGWRSLFWGHKIFYGIPYATMVERFKDAGEPPKWKHTFKALDPFVVCNQYSPFIRLYVGQEDCLVVNIRTPHDATEDSLLPVMVYIHGGGYYFGSGSIFLYSPEYLVDKNVIVVTLNYRLGAFGFLCLGTEDAPGNVGLRDQLAALRWVNKNIRYFGGDPNKVTIVGESAGSASVSYHVMTPNSRGLFNGAIMESGTILSPFAFQSDNIKGLFIVAKNLGYRGNDVNEALRVLKNAKAKRIVKASENNDKNAPNRPYIFKPCIEKPLPGVELIIDRSPSELLKQNSFHEIPIIIGYNNKEGIYYGSKFTELGMKKLNRDFTPALPDNLIFKNDTIKQQEVVEDIKSFYFPRRVTRSQLYDYFSDFYFHCPTILFMEELLKTYHTSIYSYYFKYSSLRNLSKFNSFRPFTKGASHGDEMFYLFNPLVFELLINKKADRRMIDTMTTMWTNFVKNGEPKSYNQWEKNINGTLKFLSIDKNQEMIPMPNVQRINFCRKYYS